MLTVGELEGATVLGEETVSFICRGVFARRDAVVRRHLSGLLDV